MRWRCSWKMLRNQFKLKIKKTYRSHSFRNNLTICVWWNLLFFNTSFTEKHLTITTLLTVQNYYNSWCCLSNSYKGKEITWGKKNKLTELIKFARVWFFEMKIPLAFAKKTAEMLSTCVVVLLKMRGNSKVKSVAILNSFNVSL